MRIKRNQLRKMIAEAMLSEMRFGSSSDRKLATLANWFYREGFKVGHENKEIIYKVAYAEDVQHPDDFFTRKNAGLVGFDGLLEAAFAKRRIDQQTVEYETYRECRNEFRNGFVEAVYDVFEEYDLPGPEPDSEDY